MQFYAAVHTAINANKNIIISYPFIMLSPRKIINIYKTAKGAGYVTEAAFLSVDFKRASQGVDFRYVRTLKGEDTGEIPRRLKPWRNKIFHYAVPLTLKILTENKNVDKVRLFDRNGDELKDSKLKTFISEQNRQWSESEHEEYRERQNEINEFINQNKKLFYQKLYQ